MKNVFLALVLLVITDIAFPYAKTPKIDIAPGHICTKTDKDFDRLRYDESMAYCKRNVAVKTKDKVCAADGVSGEERRKYYTVDHIIPLSAGGSNDIRNLWCQNKRIYTGNVEYWYYKQLRDGKMKQAEVVRAMMAMKFNPKAVIRPPEKALEVLPQWFLELDAPVSEP